MQASLIFVDLLLDRIGRCEQARLWMALCVWHACNDLAACSVVRSGWVEEHLMVHLFELDARQANPQSSRFFFAHGL